jgi:hypothetical protein
MPQTRRSGRSFRSSMATTDDNHIAKPSQQSKGR